MSATHIIPTETSPAGELDWIVRLDPSHSHTNLPCARTEPRVIVIRDFPWLATPATSHENLPRL